MKQTATPTAHYSTKGNATNSRWLMDVGVSHYITYDLSNLSNHSEYDGADEVILGDGSGLKVTHIGSSTLSCDSQNLKFENTLSVSSLHKT